MIDYRLRFPTIALALAVLRPFGMTYMPEEGNEQFIKGSHQWALDIVGEILGKEGFHINLRLVDITIDVTSLNDYLVYPSSPHRVWA